MVVDGSRVRDKEARMRKMIEVALDLFADQGYGPVSTRQIADAAGCSETLLFRYFGGKHGLLQAISKEILDQTEDPGDSLADCGDPGELVERYLLRVFEGVRKRAPALKVVVAALVNEPDMAADFKRMHDREVDVVARELERLQQSGAVGPDFDVRAVATAIEEAGFALGFLMQVVYGVPRRELESIAGNFAAALSQGLRGPAPTTPVPDALRRKTLGAARNAYSALDRVIALLDGGDT
jgi:AcrR family transcriptional regulator